MADDGTHRARAGAGAARAAIRRSRAVAGPWHVGDFVAAYPAECHRCSGCLPNADAAGGRAVRVVSELPRFGHPAAASEFGVADC